MAAVTRRTKLHIHFKEENNIVSIEKVFQPGAGPGGEVEVPLSTTTPPGGTPLGQLVTFPGSTCISLNIGGGFYEICF
jgi:hypothetical protein